MKRNFFVGLFGGLIGLAMMLMLLSAAGVVGARAIQSQPNAARTQEVSAATPLTSTFTYQGQLQSGGKPISATCSFQFGLWDALNGGNQIGVTQTVSSLGVNNGYFTALLNSGNEFGVSAFTGDARWLEITVQCLAVSGAPVTLKPRQSITAAPYALFSTSTGALQGRSISTTAPGTGQVLKWNGGVWSPADDAIGSSGSGWLLTGNAGTNASTNFVGTTDNVTLTLRVSNTVGWRLVPSGVNTPNVIGGNSGNWMTSGVAGATIGGGGTNGLPNRVTDHGGVVGGGYGNQAGDNAGTTSDSSYATVGGGAGNIASGPFATVGGGANNIASRFYATVGGGDSNTASGNGAFVGGGGWDGIDEDTIGNQAVGDASTIGGGLGNSISVTGTYATIGGGESNSVSGDRAFVGGGDHNQATSHDSTVAGGGTNKATSQFSTVSGGVFNTASGPSATVGGGDHDIASGDHATVGGGQTNSASAGHATVGGGDTNNASANNATIGGGRNNTASNWDATVGGGTHNQATGDKSFVGGGDSNIASGIGAFIGGGGNDGTSAVGNQASGNASTIGGGWGNSIPVTGTYATVGGGKSNTASDNYDTVGGGSSNSASNGWCATVSGGDSNNASGDHATIGGGWNNLASNNSATVGGGYTNTASNQVATVGGGWDNHASGYAATVGGGGHSSASNWYATVSGGDSNTASGDHATVPGGSNSSASHYGEMAYASGQFTDKGDAQTSLYVVRNTTTDATPTELFLNGSGQRITIASYRTVTFDILVVARSNAGKSAGYRIVGVITNQGGATAFIGTPMVNDLGEDVMAWGVAVEANDINDALEVKVTGAAATTIRWVASVRTVEVGY